MSEAISEFLRAAGWGAATMTPLPGDASARRYARLAMEGRSALLMIQPPDQDAAPAGETETRQGYNAVARLAGADCKRFAAAADYLRAQGLAAPEIYAADFKAGLLLIEDFGDRLFTDALAAGANERDLYAGAARALARLHRQPAPKTLPGGMPLHAYDSIAMLAETNLVLEWFLPLALERAATDAEVEHHRKLWTAALDDLSTARPVFVHRDYHAQNLLWLPERDGVAQVGLIDFQDAVAGSPAYDLISLTEDARRAVSPELAEHTLQHYLAALAEDGARMNEDQFRRDMALMAAQRNIKIVGIFARLFKRDGKRRYLSLLPLVWSYLDRDLAHPALADLRNFYDRLIPVEKRTVPHLEKEPA